MLLLWTAVVTAAKVTVNVTHLCGLPPPPLPPPPPTPTPSSPPQPQPQPNFTDTQMLLAAVRRGQWAAGFAYAGQTAAATTGPNGPGPVAMGQTRFPNAARYGENVKLDQQTSLPDSGDGAAAGPFGVGFASVGDAGLRFVGAAEAAVMWRGVPAELALDLAGNAYGWDVVVKKVTSAKISK